jgi:hypothetical protein
MRRVKSMRAAPAVLPRPHRVHTKSTGNLRLASRSPRRPVAGLGVLVLCVGSVFATSAGSALVTAQPAGASPGLTVADLNNGTTPSAMANALVGGGVTVSNVTYTGDNRAAGKVTGGTGIIGFDSSIVLDSGKAQTYSTDPQCSKGVEGPNLCHEKGGPNGNSNSTAFGTAGDADLTALSGFPTFDASVLQFDFVPTFSTVQFKYVFSSEEYSDYSNTSFNDVFGFFVNGTNCALVPGTNQPVSVNTINNGNDVGGDPTPHSPSLFIDNVNPAPHLNTEMDGLTVVLTCNANVTAGQSNHMKLAIADASDAILDSAVFIQAGSLVSGTQISTSLSGGGQSGQAITVPPGTAVTDSATLTGANSGTAGGTVAYKLFSDSACTALIQAAGTKTVTNGAVPNSDPVTLSSPPVIYWQASYSGDALNNPSTSPCGSETETISGGVDTTPPACALTAVIPGPPKQIQVTIQDSDGGLQSITVTTAVNSTVVIPPFTVGTKNPVVVTATKTDQTKPSRVALRATDLAGNVKNCDPILTTLTRGDDSVQTFTDVPGAEHFVRIFNGNPGLRNVVVTVNGHVFRVSLTDGANARLNIRWAMHAGNNTIILQGHGPRGSSGDVIIQS